jgi:hypothetical protein
MAANDATTAAIAAATSRSTTNTGAISLAQHTPSLAGSVLECADGFGGTLLIRLQNMSATGKREIIVSASIVQLFLRSFTLKF